MGNVLLRTEVALQLNTTFPGDSEGLGGSVAATVAAVAAGGSVALVGKVMAAEKVALAQVAVKVAQVAVQVLAQA